MPIKPKRKTEEMKKAATDGEAGESFRAVAKDRNIDRSTLRRDIKRKEERKRKQEVQRNSRGERVFTQEGEGASDQIKKLLTSSMALLQRNAVNWL